MPEPYEWRPISDLPPDAESLSSGELGPLLEVWNDQRADTEASGVVGRFHQRLQRQWAIETGILENLYSVDRGTTELLIARGIDATLIPHLPPGNDPVTTAAIIQDQADVLEGLFAFVKSERRLTTSYIRELHAALLRHQPTTIAVDQFGNPVEITVERGEYKSHPNNPRRPDGAVHEYCPPEHVAAEMDRLVDLHQCHIDRGVPVEVRAAWLHHRFTQIHPFTDGNGRVARAIASLLFIKAGWFPLVIDRDQRAAYFDALELADSGNLRPLVDMFETAERRSYIDLLNVRDTVTEPMTVDAVIASAREVLTQKQAVSSSRMQRVLELSQTLNGIAGLRIGEIAAKLHQELRRVPELNVSVSESAGLPADSVASAADALGYDPEALKLTNYAALYIGSPGNLTVGVAFVKIGRSFHGVMGALAVAVSGPKIEVTADLFQFNYRDDPASLRNRFSAWLEPALAAGLRKWRSTLA